VRAGSTTATGIAKELAARVLRSRMAPLRGCYQAALQQQPDLSGVVVHASLTVDAAGKPRIDTAGSSDAGVARCFADALAGLTFPSGPATVKTSFHLSLGAPFGSSSFGRDLVLTRLHARYDKDRLTEDFVFREAPAIVGGRERMREGALEQGAHEDGVNNFQARYAIRNAWTGAVACEDPARGRWGGQPPASSEGQGLPARTEVPTDIQGARGNKVVLADLLASQPAAAAVASASPVPSASTGPVANDEAAPTQGCGCVVPRHDDDRPAWGCCAAAIGLWWWRRRRCRQKD
jgi:hypothetical protein